MIYKTHACLRYKSILITLSPTCLMNTNTNCHPVTQMARELITLKAFVMINFFTLLPEDFDILIL